MGNVGGIVDNYVRGGIDCYGYGECVMDKVEREKLRENSNYLINKHLVLSLLDHIDALEARIIQLTGRTFSDRVYAAMEANVKQMKERIDALEGQIKDARWRVNDVREQLLGPFHAMDEFGATSLNLKQVVEILGAAIASAGEVKENG